MRTQMVASLVHVHQVSLEMAEIVKLVVKVKLNDMEATLCYLLRISYNSFYILDIDECADGTDDCEEGTTCVNTEGGFMCVGMSINHL